ncbi:hypothetical protein DM806_24075 [Sphingobium lactosutens]|uniref:hypothetical protein n=1 Tax=Sphingobium lactosutens TaxID=522773 RepID=UPI0015BAD991|nr:hypothetical protein [Sphingobium lactosutens]NWK98684.1 hypothetical protein [Sphingobium lactosutens]
MTKRKTAGTISVTKDEADRLYIELGKVRAWLSGFAAARQGGQGIALNAGPSGADSLRQVQNLLREVK